MVVGADALGDGAEQGQRMQAQRDQLVTIGRVRTRESARQPGGAKGKALGDVGPIVLSGGHLQAAAADVDHQQPAGREGRPVPGGQVGEARLLGPGEHGDGHPGHLPHRPQGLDAVAGLPDGRGGEANERVGPELVGAVTHARHRVGEPLDRLLGQEHGREGGLGQAQGLALAGDRHKGAVGLAVDHDQVDGVGADVEDGQTHQWNLPGGRNDPDYWN